MLRRHEVEVVGVCTHANSVFGKFFTENTAVKILQPQPRQRGSRPRIVRENQPEHADALACAPKPPCEYLESRLVVKWSHNIRCGPLQHADITLELAYHFYEIFMNVKPLVQRTGRVAQAP